MLRTLVIFFSIMLVGCGAILPHKGQEVSVDSNVMGVLKLATVKLGTDTLTIIPDTVNLTEEGTLDWAQWGYGAEEWTDTSQYNHKAGIAPIINLDTIVVADQIPDGKAARAFLYTEPTGSEFTWTDGTPTDSVQNLDAGIWIPGMGNGFRITVPAGVEKRILKLYVGAWKATGKLTASLSDSSSLDVSGSFKTTSMAYSTLNVREFAIEYSAARNNETLAVTWIVGEYYDEDGWGNVTLRAATLSE